MRCAANTFKRIREFFNGPAEKYAMKNLQQVVRLVISISIARLRSGNVLVEQQTKPKPSGHGLIGPVMEHTQGNTYTQPETITNVTE